MEPLPPLSEIEQYPEFIEATPERKAEVYDNYFKRRKEEAVNEDDYNLLLKEQADRNRNSVKVQIQVNHPFVTDPKYFPKELQDQVQSIYAMDQEFKFNQEEAKVEQFKAPDMEDPNRSLGVKPYKYNGQQGYSIRYPNGDVESVPGIASKAQLTEYLKTKADKFDGKREGVFDKYNPLAESELEGVINSINKVSSGLEGALNQSIKTVQSMGQGLMLDTIDEIKKAANRYSEAESTIAQLNPQIAAEERKINEFGRGDKMRLAELKQERDAAAAIVASDKGQSYESIAPVLKEKYKELIDSLNETSKIGGAEVLDTYNKYIESLPEDQRGTASAFSNYFKDKPSQLLPYIATTAIAAAPDIAAVMGSSLVAGAIGGPTAAAATGQALGFTREYTATLMSEMQLRAARENKELTPETLNSYMDNPLFMDKVRTMAEVRGAVIGGADAVLGGAAQKVVESAVTGRVKKALLGGAIGVFTEGTGEGLAQVASGQKTNFTEIFNEAIGGIGATAVSVPAIMIDSSIKARKAAKTQEMVEMVKQRVEAAKFFGTLKDKKTAEQRVQEMKDKLTPVPRVPDPTAFEGEVEAPFVGETATGLDGKQGFPKAAQKPFAAQEQKPLGGQVQRPFVGETEQAFGEETPFVGTPTAPVAPAAPVTPTAAPEQTAPAEAPSVGPAPEQVAPINPMAETAPEQAAPVQETQSTENAPVAETPVAPVVGPAATTPSTETAPAPQTESTDPNAGRPTLMYFGKEMPYSVSIKQEGGGFKVKSVKIYLENGMYDTVRIPKELQEGGFATIEEAEAAGPKLLAEAQKKMDAEVQADKTKPTTKPPSGVIINGVRYTNARELIESLDAEYGAALAKILDANPAIKKALENIPVEPGNSPYFDGKKIVLSSTANLEITKAHELTHAILDVALDTVNSFNQDINNLMTDLIKDKSVVSKRVADIIEKVRSLHSTSTAKLNVAQYMAKYINYIFDVLGQSQEFKNNPLTDAELERAYAFLSPHEFLAAIMSDPKFRNTLIGKKITPERKSIITKIVDAIKKLFGKIGPSLPKNEFEKLISIIENAVRNPVYTPGQYKRSYNRDGSVNLAVPANEIAAEKEAIDNLPENAPIEDVVAVAPVSVQQAVSTYQPGQTFAQWSAAAVASVGNSISRFLTTIWKSLRLAIVGIVAASTGYTPEQVNALKSDLPAVATISPVQGFFDMPSPNLLDGFTPQFFPQELPAAPVVTSAPAQSSSEQVKTATNDLISKAIPGEAVSLDPELQNSWLSSSQSTPAMTAAAEFMGQREGVNPILAKIFKSFGINESQDLYPWCAAFTSYCLTKAGIPTRIFNSRGFLQTGKSVPTTSAKSGDVVVLWNDNPKTGGKTGWGGHAGFYVGETENHIILLSGNANDEVNVSAFPKERVLEVRRPSESQEGSGALYSLNLDPQSTENRSDNAFSEKAYQDVEEGFKSRKKIVSMPIKDFLKLAKPIETDYRRPEAQDSFNKGIKWDSIPELRTEKGGKVRTHEGRHRAEVLLNAGYTHMPVVINDRLIRWSEADPASVPTELTSEVGNDKVPMPELIKGNYLFQLTEEDQGEEINKSSQPVITRASFGDSQIYLSFDASGPKTNVEDIKKAFSGEDYSAEVTEFQSDFVSATSGIAKYRIDIFNKGNGTMSSPETTRKAYQNAFGTTERIANKSVIELQGSLTDRFAQVYESNVFNPAGQSKNVLNGIETTAGITHALGEVNQDTKDLASVAVTAEEKETVAKQAERDIAQNRFNDLKKEYPEILKDTEFDGTNLQQAREKVTEFLEASFDKVDAEGKEVSDAKKVQGAKLQVNLRLALGILPEKIKETNMTESQVGYVLDAMEYIVDSTQDMTNMTANKMRYFNNTLASFADGGALVGMKGVITKTFISKWKGILNEVIGKGAIFDKPISPVRSGPFGNLFSGTLGTMASLAHEVSYIGTNEVAHGFIRDLMGVFKDNIDFKQLEETAAIESWYQHLNKVLPKITNQSDHMIGIAARLTQWDKAAKASPLEQMIERNTQLTDSFADSDFVKMKPKGAMLAFDKEQAAIVKKAYDALMSGIDLASFPDEAAAIAAIEARLSPEQLSVLNKTRDMGKAFLPFLKNVKAVTKNVNLQDYQNYVHDSSITPREGDERNTVKESDSMSDVLHDRQGFNPATTYPETSIQAIATNQAKSSAYEKHTGVERYLFRQLMSDPTFTNVLDKLDKSTGISDRLIKLAKVYNESMTKNQPRAGPIWSLIESTAALVMAAKILGIDPLIKNGTGGLISRLTLGGLDAQALLDGVVYEQNMGKINKFLKNNVPTQYNRTSQYDTIVGSEDRYSLSNKIRLKRELGSNKFTKSWLGAFLISTPHVPQSFVNMIQKEAVSRASNYSNALPERQSAFAIWTAAYIHYAKKNGTVIDAKDFIARMPHDKRAANDANDFVTMAMGYAPDKASKGSFWNGSTRAKQVLSKTLFGFMQQSTGLAVTAQNQLMKSQRLYRSGNIAEANKSFLVASTAISNVLVFRAMTLALQGIVLYPILTQYFNGADDEEKKKAILKVKKEYKDTSDRSNLGALYKDTASILFPLFGSAPLITGLFNVGADMAGVVASTQPDGSLLEFEFKKALKVQSTEIKDQLEALDKKIKFAEKMDLQDRPEFDLMLKEEEKLMVIKDEIAAKLKFSYVTADKTKSALAPFGMYGMLGELIYNQTKSFTEDDLTTEQQIEMDRLLKNEITYKDDIAGPGFLNGMIEKPYSIIRKSFMGEMGKSREERVPTFISILKLINAGEDPAVILERSRTLLAKMIAKKNVEHNRKVRELQEKLK